MRWTKILFRAGVGVTLLCHAAGAGEWPRFLGPDGTGVVEKGEKVAHSWPADGPEQIWRIQTGSGFGGAAIANGKVYFLDRKNSQDILRVLHLKTGEPIWEQAYDTPGYKGGFPGSRATPTVDGDLVFTVGVMGQLTCFDVANKKIGWSKSLPKDFGAVPGGWGFAQSPLVVRDMMIVSVAGGDNGIVALNKKSGAIIWKNKAFADSEAYPSPALMTLAGEEQIVMWQNGVLAGFNPADGDKWWGHEWPARRPIPQPLHLGEGKFFLTTGYGNGCAMIRVKKSDQGKWESAELFQDNRSGSKVPPALFYQGHIYTNSDDNKRGLQCFDANGDLKWETGRRPAFGLGSLIIADGVIFIIDDSTGDLVMVEASPKAYKELGRARVLGGKDIWAPLALCDGLLVIRDQGQMKCVNVGSDEQVSDAR